MYERQVKALGDKMYSIEVRINNVERSDKMKVDTQRVGVSEWLQGKLKGTM
jgi:hypothetical protein